MLHQKCWSSEGSLAENTLECSSLPGAGDGNPGRLSSLPLPPDVTSAVRWGQTLRVETHLRIGVVSVIIGVCRRQLQSLFLWWSASGSGLVHGLLLLHLLHSNSILVDETDSQSNVVKMILLRFPLRFSLSYNICAVLDLLPQLGVFIFPPPVSVGEMFVDVTNLREAFLTLRAGIFDCVAVIVHRSEVFVVLFAFFRVCW